MRTDHDTWDITTSVGSTALFVAAARALEAQKANPVAVDPFAEEFCRAVGGQWSDLLDGQAPEHALRTEFGEHFVNFQAVRTRYFDTYYTKAAAAGVRQVVLLAAGLDSRAYRLDWPAGTVVYELDQPQVLEFKREVLAGRAPTAQRREIAVDLRDDWTLALRNRGFDESAPSAWIAEGLLLYLPAVAQHELFTGIERLAASGSHVAVEESVPMPGAVFEALREAERVGSPGSSMRGGPFFQLIFNEQCEPAAAWFGKRGWRADATPLPEYLLAHGRPAAPSDSEAGAMTAAISLVSAIKR